MRHFRNLFRLFIILVAGTVGFLVFSGLRDHPGRADVALVPGNTVLPSGLPSPRLQARLDRAVDLYRQGYFPTIIVSGAMGREGYDEASVMAEYLRRQGLPAGSIVEDHGGATTYDSARFTAAWLPDRQNGRVLVVTQYFHVPRTTLALRRFGVGTVLTAPATFFEARDLYSIARELVAWPVYALKSYPVTAPPAPPAVGR